MTDSLKEEINTNEYKCAHCKKIFEKGWSDGEALTEMSDNFPYNLNVLIAMEDLE